MSVPRKESPNQYGDILLFGERRREREAVGDSKRKMSLISALDILMKSCRS